MRRTEKEYFSVDFQGTEKFHQAIRVEANTIHYAAFCPKINFDVDQVVPENFGLISSEEFSRNPHNKEFLRETYAQFLNNIRPSCNDTGFVLNRKTDAFVYSIDIENYEVEKFDIKFAKIIKNKELSYGEANEILRQKKDRSLKFIHDFSLHHYNKTYGKNEKSLRMSTVNTVLTEVIQKNMYDLTKQKSIGCVGQIKNQRTHVLTSQANQNQNDILVPATASRKGKHCINIMSGRYYAENKTSLFPEHVLAGVANFYQFVAA